MSMIFTAERHDDYIRSTDQDSLLKTCWTTIYKLLNMPARCGIAGFTLAESTVLETMQRRALRMMYRDEDSYTALLIKADLHKLSEHKRKVLYPCQPY